MKTGMKLGVAIAAIVSSMAANTPAFAATTFLDTLTARVQASTVARQTYQSISQLESWVVPDDKYTGVGGLFIQTQSSGGGGFLCTGSLIGSNTVLTAAHCLNTGSDTITRIRMFLPGYANAAGGIAGREVINANGFAINPGFNGNVLGGSDVAIVGLATSASASRDIYSLYDGDSELDNLSYQKIGTGTIGTGSTGTFEGPNEPGDFDLRKRAGLNEYEFYWSDVLEALGFGACTGTDAFGAACKGILAFDYDSGRARNDVFGRYMGKADLGRTLYGVNVEANSSPGDSGGPTFIDGKIAGVTSFGITGSVFEPGDCAIVGSVDQSKGLDGGCTDSSWGEISGDARVGEYASWIRQFITGNPATVMPGVWVPASIPEPASWAMMIAGFGLVGAGTRRARVSKVSYAA